MTAKYTVQELVDLQIIEKPLDGNHGSIHPTSKDYVEDGIPFIMASDLSNGLVNFSSCKFITEKQANTLRKGFSIAGDILLSHKATIGRTATVQENKYPFLVLTPQVTYYRVKDKQKLNNLYLKYYFDSQYFQSILQQWAGSGSTRAYIGITEQLKLPIILPDIDTQNEIVDIINRLDQKIYLNTQINQTLEQIAQALFKSWFVDFDPVRAKVQALSDGMSLEQAELAAMQAISGKTPEELTALSQTQPERYAELAETAKAFPCEMVEVDGVEVPKGWEVKALEDLISLISGTQIPKEEHIYEAKEGYERFIQNRDYSSDNHITYVKISNKNKRCSEKDILIDRYGDAGKIRFGIEGVYNIALAKIVLDDDSLTEYLRWFLMQPKQKAYFEQASGASTRASLNSSTFKGINITIPSKLVLSYFSNISDLYLKNSK
ncbi:TPA: restriction endonuclease subunit S, partial [Haemophilus influenzae]